ncbi:hypothetical protein H8N00_16975 [Streptomyces sp. AC563]|uniref:amidase family protein n=1 Tax=Streptomyces buecherae TaxID=2763006 RepID=UPI00164DDD02|nr:amidase family protein [Streptomyces buecherae]MBC3990541.1 hypothetical protein [Streptomyces buecherae]
MTAEGRRSSAAAAGQSGAAEEQTLRCLRLLRNGPSSYAFTQVDATAALAAARTADQGEASGLPLRGTVLAVKDNIDTAGFATTAGTPALRGNRPQHDAPAVAALRAAGAVVVGKANMHELAYGTTSDNAVYGRVRNPLRPDRIAGGSSGGSAAAVAAGTATAALGTETGCSVRVPASLCGVVGFRPTVGTYPGGGVVPVSTTRDAIGLMARTVEEVWALDRVLRHPHRTAGAGPSPSGGRVRLLAPRHPFLDGMTPELRVAFEACLASLASAGIDVVEAELPDGVHRHATACGLRIALHETPSGIDRYLASHGLPLRFAQVAARIAGPDVAAILRPLVRRPVPVEEYRHALERRASLGRLLRRHLQRHQGDALVVPTTITTAPRLLPGDRVDVAGRALPAFATLVRNADLSSALGWPAVSLPAVRDGQGLPLGIDLQFPPGADTALLSVARTCERVWATERHR